MHNVLKSTTDWKQRWKEILQRKTNFEKSDKSNIERERVREDERENNKNTTERNIYTKITTTATTF